MQDFGTLCSAILIWAFEASILFLVEIIPTHHVFFSNWHHKKLHHYWIVKLSVFSLTLFVRQTTDLEYVGWLISCHGLIYVFWMSDHFLISYSCQITVFSSLIHAWLQPFSNPYCSFLTLLEIYSSMTLVLFYLEMRNYLSLASCFFEVGWIDVQCLGRWNPFPWHWWRCMFKVCLGFCFVNG